MGCREVLSRELGMVAVEAGQPEEGHRECH
jgi:hypothetical protein